MHSAFHVFLPAFCAGMILQSLYRCAGPVAPTRPTTLMLLVAAVYHSCVALAGSGDRLHISLASYVSALSLCFRRN
jgi:hypothetical protein